MKAGLHPGVRFTPHWAIIRREIKTLHNLILHMKKCHVLDVMQDKSPYRHLTDLKMYYRRTVTRYTHPRKIF